MDDLAPAERDRARSICSFFDQRLVELPAGAAVDLCPAVLAVILETRDVGTEERSELASASRTLAFITHLVIQNVRLHFNLQEISATFNKLYSSMVLQPISWLHWSVCYKLLDSHLKS